MLSVRLHISWESCLFRVVFHIMQAAWGKQEETELLHITALLRAWTVLAACRINLPSSPPAVWALWRASAETALTASAGNAPANEHRNTRRRRSVKDYSFTRIAFFCCCLFHAEIFDNLSVVNRKYRGMLILEKCWISYLEEFCFIVNFWLSCFEIDYSSAFMSKRNPAQRWLHHFKEKINSARQTCIESDNVANWVNETLIRTVLQHMPQQLFWWFIHHMSAMILWLRKISKEVLWHWGNVGELCFWRFLEALRYQERIEGHG